MWRTTLAAAVDHGQISLLVRPHALTDAQADHHLIRIIEALPALQQVVHDPRRHLRVDEAVRPVSVVRRTGPAALRHLSQHSEHWESRTVTGLRPARLLAKVIDDDLDLYENRFIVTLVKQLHRRMAKLVTFVDTGLTQAQSAFAIECYAEERADPQARRMLHALLPRSSDTELLMDLELFERLKCKVEKILNVLTECEETQLFRSLRRVSPVQSPILPTNILTMDPHYRVLFDLWHELERLTPENQGTGEVPADIEQGYSSFCGVLVWAALRHAGFEPEMGDEQICIKRNDGVLAECGKYVRDDWRAEIESSHKLSVSGIVIKLRRRVHKSFEIPAGIPTPQIPENLSNIFAIVGSVVEFLDQPTEAVAVEIGQLWHVATRHELNRKRRGREDVGVKWKSFIDSAIRKLPDPETFSIVILPVLSSVGIDPHDASSISEFYLNMASGLPGDFSLRIVALPSGCRDVALATRASIIRRLLNYGDAFFESDSEKWARRSGILQLSPWTLNSLQRVNRLIETSMLKHDIESERLTEACPICESTFTTASDQQQGFSRECRQCGTLWGTNRCRWCSSSFPWLRLRRKPLEQSFEELGYARWIEKLELAAGTKAFPSFCESAKSPPAGVPICPYCGRCARKDKVENCPRCSFERSAPEILLKSAPH